MYIIHFNLMSQYNPLGCLLIHACSEQVAHIHLHSNGYFRRHSLIAAAKRTHHIDTHARRQESTVNEVIIR